MNASTSRLIEWLQQSTCTVAFTGAGISTESGIPDFRSPDGIWARSQPVLYDEFLRSAEARHEYWRQKCASHDGMAGAQPNAGHLALAGFERAERLRAVITQNIDGLHQRAGSRTVLELHGTALWVGCLDCPWRAEADPYVRQYRLGGLLPECPACGGLVKHATISFGQALPENVLREAMGLARSARLFLALGSSLVVEPAASLPVLAKRCGARLVIINRDPTPLDGLADLVIHAGIGETLGAVVASLGETQPAVET
jgi:NAD-dependent deacetylase